MAEIYIPGGCNCCNTAPLQPCGCSFDPPCPTQFPAIVTCSVSGFSSWGIFFPPPLPEEVLAPYYELFNVELTFFPRTYDFTATSVSGKGLTSFNICNTTGQSPWLQLVQVGRDFGIFYQDFLGAFSECYLPIALGAQLLGGNNDVSVQSYLIRRGCCSLAGKAGAVFPVDYVNSDRTKTYLIFSISQSEGFLGLNPVCMIYSSNTNWCTGPLNLTLDSAWSQYTGGGNQDGIWSTFIPGSANPFWPVTSPFAFLQSWPASLTLNTPVTITCPSQTPNSFTNCSLEPGGPTSSFDRCMFFSAFPDPNLTYPPGGASFAWSGVNNTGVTFAEFVLYPRSDFFGHCAWEGWYAQGLNYPEIQSPTPPTSPYTFTGRLEYLGSSNWQFKILQGTITDGSDTGLIATYTGVIDPGVASTPSVPKKLILFSSTGLASSVPTYFYFW